MEHEDRTDDIAKAGMSSLFKKRRDPTEMGASTTVPWQDGNTMSSTGGPDQYAPRTPYAGKVRDALEGPAPEGPSFIDAMKQGLDLGGTSVPEKVEAPEEPKADALGPEVDANETEVEPIPSGGGKVDTPVDDAVEIPEKVEIQDVPETDAEGMSTNLTDEDRAAWNERYRTEQEGEQENAPEEPEADEAPLTDDDAFRERYGEERYAAARNWAKLLGKGAMAVGQGVLDSDWGDDAVHAFDSTRRIVSAFLTGNPLSAASAIVGESVSNLNRMADSSEEIGRRMGIMAGANEKLLNDTIVGKLHGRKVEQDRRITNDVLMKVDDALSSLGADDITQLTSEQLDGFFDRMAAGHDEATRALKEYYAGERDLTPMEREAAYKQMKVYGQVISDIAQHSDEKKKEYARQSARLRQLNANRNRLEKQRSLALIERKRRDTTGLGRVAMEVLGDRVDLDDKGRPPERTWTRFANNLESRLNSSDLTPEQRQSYTNALSWVRHASKTPEDISRERMLAGTTDEGRFIHGLTQRGIPVNPDGSYNRSHAGTVALNAEEWISKHPDATPEQVALARKVADEAKELAKPDSRKRREQRDAEFRARYDASSPEAREIYDMMGDKAQEIVVDDQGYPNPDKARMVRNKALAQSKNPALTDDQRTRYKEIAKKMQAYLDGPVKVARQEAEARWQSEATDWSRFMRDEIIGAKSTIAVDPRTGEVALKDKKIAAERIDGYLRKNPGLDPQMRSALEATRDKWMREREGYLDSRRSTTRRKAIFENRDLSIAERLMGGHENTPRSDTGVNGITGYSLSAQILSKDMERASQWQDENIRLDYPEVYAAMGQGMSMEDMENSQDPELKAEFDRMIHDPKFIANQHAVDNLRRMTEYKTVERRIRDVATMRGVPREEVNRDLAELRYQCYDTINRRAEDGSASEYIPPSEDGPYMDLMMDILENYGLAKPVSDGEGEQSAEGTGQPKQRRSTTRRDGGGITRNYFNVVNNNDNSTNIEQNQIFQYADNRSIDIDYNLLMMLQNNTAYTQNNTWNNFNGGAGPNPQGATTGGRRSGTRGTSRRTSDPNPSATPIGVEEDVEPPTYQQPEAKRSISADHGIHNRLVEINKQFGDRAKGTPESRLALYNEIQEMFGGDVPTAEELDEEYLALEDDWRRQMGLKTIPPDVKKQLKQAVYGTPNPTSIRGRLRAYHNYDPSEDELAIETRRQEEEKARADAEAKEYERRREERVYNFDDRGGELTEEERREFNERFNGSPDPTPVDYTAEAEAYIDRIMEDIQSGNISAEDADRNLDEELQWMDEEKRAAFKDVMARRMPGYDTPEEPPVTEETEVEEPQADTEVEAEESPVTEETKVETEEKPIDETVTTSDPKPDVETGDNAKLKAALESKTYEEGVTDLGDLSGYQIPNMMRVLARLKTLREMRVPHGTKDDQKMVADLENVIDNADYLNQIYEVISNKPGAKEHLQSIEGRIFGPGGRVRYNETVQFAKELRDAVNSKDFIQKEKDAPKVELKQNKFDVGADTLKNAGYTGKQDSEDRSGDAPSESLKIKRNEVVSKLGFKEYNPVGGIPMDEQSRNDIRNLMISYAQGNELDEESMNTLKNAGNTYTKRLKKFKEYLNKVKKEYPEGSEEFKIAEEYLSNNLLGGASFSGLVRDNKELTQILAGTFFENRDAATEDAKTNTVLGRQESADKQAKEKDKAAKKELRQKKNMSKTPSVKSTTRRTDIKKEQITESKQGESQSNRTNQGHSDTSEVEITKLKGYDPKLHRSITQDLVNTVTQRAIRSSEGITANDVDDITLDLQDIRDNPDDPEVFDERKTSIKNTLYGMYLNNNDAEDILKELLAMNTSIRKAKSFRDMMSSAMEDFAKTHNKTMEDHIMRDGFRPTEHS